MTSGRWKACAAAAGLMAVLAACSANEYRKPVGNFDAAVQESRAALSDYLVLEARSATSADILLRSDLDQRLAFGSGACLPGSAPGDCVATLEAGPGPGGDPLEPLVLASAPVDESHDALMAAVADYSANLAEVVDASTGEGVTESAKGLGAAITALAGRVDDVAATDFGSLVGPVTTAVTWVGGTYVEVKRLRILREAVSTADKPLQTACPLLRDRVEEARSIVLNDLRNSIEMAVDRANLISAAMAGPGTAQSKAHYAVQKEALLRSILALSERSRRLLAADPGAAYSEMCAAHSALRERLENPELSLERLTAALKRFAAKAKDAQAVIAGLRNRGE